MQAELWCRINRAKDRFNREHRSSATREHVRLLIEEISGQLDNSEEAEDVRTEMRSWFSQFQLEDDLRKPVEDFDSLQTAIQSLAYVGKRKSAKAKSATASATGIDEAIDKSG